MRKIIFLLIIHISTNEIVFSQTNPNNNNNIESIYIKMWSEKVRERTKLEFYNQLYNFEALKTILEFRDSLNIEIIQDSAKVSEIVGQANIENLQLMKFILKNSNIFLKSDIRQKLKPFIYRSSLCK